MFKKEKKISKFVYTYAIIILLISSFGSIRLLIPEKGERFNIAATLGSSQSLYLEEKESALPIDVYMDYIQKTIIKANKSEAKLMLFAEEAFSIKGPDRKDIINPLSSPFAGTPAPKYRYVNTETLPPGELKGLISLLN